MNKRFFIKILVIGVILLLAARLIPFLLENTESISTHTFVRALFFIVLAWVIGYAFFSRRREGPTHIKSILLWLLIFVLLIIAYAFRFELGDFKDRILAVLLPSYSYTNDSGELVIARHRNGHFYLYALTENNNKIKFLVDTGASDIAITQKDAIKLGIDPDKLKYTQKYRTASGSTYSAPIRIKQLTIGKKTFYNLKAHVSSGGLGTSLLGMTVIEDFDDFKITNDLLILNY